MLEHDDDTAAGVMKNPESLPTMHCFECCLVSSQTTNVPDAFRPAPLYLQPLNSENSRAHLLSDQMGPGTASYECRVALPWRAGWRAAPEIQTCSSTPRSWWSPAWCASWLWDRHANRTLTTSSDEAASTIGETKSEEKAKRMFMSHKEKFK